MAEEPVKRSLFKVQDGQESLRVQIVEGSRVQVRWTTPEGTEERYGTTLEDLPTLLLDLPKLKPSIEEQVLWELNLMGLRGP